MDQRAPIQLKVTAKGQVTLRRELLQHLGVRPGDRISVESGPDGSVVLTAARKSGRFSDLAGILHDPNGPVLTIDDMNRIIERGWAGDL